MARTKSIPFTKMQGAGNDFVVLDETARSFELHAQDYQRLADRHFGVGADQILTVRKASVEDVDFDYVIHNADGSEVEHCGNGARCFVRFVRQNGLTSKTTIRVQTQNRTLSLTEQSDGRVTVDMGAPERGDPRAPLIDGLQGAVISMGNPHVVLTVPDVAKAPVRALGPRIQGLGLFPKGVNVGFMAITSRTQIHLRVYERGAGETLSCGTGACAAAVTAIASGAVDHRVDVQTRGGRLTIEWDGQPGSSVFLTGPAAAVFTGSITLPVTPAPSP